MNESVYFTASWRDATLLSRKLKQSDLPYVISQFSGIRDLAFVFPSNLSVSQYVILHTLFDGEAKDYLKRKEST